MAVTFDANKLIVPKKKRRQNEGRAGNRKNKRADPVSVVYSKGGRKHEKKKMAAAVDMCRLFDNRNLFEFL